MSGGTLVIDDTEKQQSKKTTRIAGVHKVKDKKSGGYFNGQELIFLVLVTELITVPVGFRWYRPDPALKALAQAKRTFETPGDSPKPTP